MLKLENVTVINLPDTSALAAAASRNLTISVTIQDEQLLVSHDGGSFELSPVILKAPVIKD